ncbi:2-phosphosulfolactate phosphatase [Longimycelium tulufanense]|nr:2-phosphosulfolactate phosphatase [Longimycelium tulufanense]
MSDQAGYDVRLEWGREGVEVLGRSCGVLVVVDVLTFSTTVDLVVARGSKVLPLRWRDERARGEAHQRKAVLGVAENGWPARPSRLPDLPNRAMLAVPSPNGATLSAAAAETDAVVLAGCLRNAGAVGAAATGIAGGHPIGVIPAGERWGAGHREGLRPAVEDFLGAGAVVAALADAGTTLSPEAELAAEALAAARPRLTELIANCSSGREVVQAGFADDAVLAAQLDSSRTVPMLVDGVFEAR